MGSPAFGSRSAKFITSLILVVAMGLSVFAYSVGIFEVGRATAAAPSRIPGATARTLPGKPVNLSSVSLVLSQVYGGGGNTGAPWRNDFMELLNPTGTAVDVTGWSVQYASATGTTWQVTALSGIIPPGGYFLIQEGGGTNGVPLPTPDIMGVINMSSAQGKVALVYNTTALSCGAPGNRCLPNPNIIDFVGYGATAADWEGSGPTGTLNNTSSAERLNSGCVDTDDNAADFIVQTSITPRNSASPPNTCGPVSPTNTVTPGGPTFTPTFTRTPSGTPTTATSPTSTFTPPPQALVMLYMVHYTQYDTVNLGDEAVRLINNSASPQPVGGWRIADASGSITLPVGASIPAQSKIWIANRATVFRSEFGFSPNFEYGADTDPNVPQATASAGFNFPDAGAGVQLFDASSANVDTLVYKSGSTSTPGWSGTSVQPYLPSGQPTFIEAGQIFYRKLDQITGLPVPDTNTNDDWAQDNDATGSTPTPGREYDDINGKKLLRPGWALTDPGLEDMFVTKKYTETNVTTKFLVGPDNEYGAVQSLIAGATSVITIETYEWHSAPLAQEIINAKNRGVRIAVVIDGNPCCLNPPRPDSDTLWAAQQWEAVGIPVYFFSGDLTTGDDNYRWNNVHAKIMLVDNQWVLTGSDNFALSSMPNDPQGNGTAGSRGAMIITNAPNVVAYTRRLIDSDFGVGRYGDLPRYPALGTPPVGYSPTPFPDMTGYTPVKPTPLVVTENESIEILQSPDNALRDADSLIGMVNRAGPGDEIEVQQQYERKYWESSTTVGPNPRLEAYIRAAQRGANVRILLDGFFEGGDCSSTTHNPATVAYVNGLGLPNLQAKVGQPTSGGPVGASTPTTGNIHNKLVLARIGTLGYSHVSSINGSLNSSKNNREYGFQVQSNAAYQYYKDVFDYDWGVGYIPCGPILTNTPTVTGTQSPVTSTPSPTGIPGLPCNVLVNSGFEAGTLTSWLTTTITMTVGVSNTFTHSGSWSAYVTHAFTATGGGSQGIQQNVANIIEGTSYALQGFVYRPDNNIQSARVRVAWYSCTDFTCSQSSTSDVFAGNRGVAGWQFFTGTVVAPTGAVAARYRIISYNANPTDSTIYWDDVEFACNPGASTNTPTVTGTNTPTSAVSVTLTRTPTPTVTRTATNNFTVTITPTGTIPTRTNTPIITLTITAVPTSSTGTPCVVPFLDVQITDYFFSGLRYLYCHGAISGYGDFTFRPYNNTTRGQMCKIIVLGYGIPIYLPPLVSFRDVPTTHPFFQYIETAAHSNIVSGYSCGTACREFHPDDLVTRAQLSKIAVIAAAWPTINPAVPRFTDVPTTDAFYTYIETAFCHGIISGYNCGIACLEFRPSANATRGQISKIVYEAIMNHPCASP